MRNRFRDENFQVTQVFGKNSKDNLTIRNKGCILTSYLGRREPLFHLVKRVTCEAVKPKRHMSQVPHFHEQTNRTKETTNRIRQHVVSVIYWLLLDVRVSRQCKRIHIIYIYEIFRTSEKSFEFLKNANVSNWNFDLNAPHFFHCGESCFEIPLQSPLQGPQLASTLSQPTSKLVLPLDNKRSKSPRLGLSAMLLTLATRAYQDLVSR